MKRVDAFIDWFVIVTSPLVFWMYWFTDNVMLLRFAALWWLVGFVVRCAHNRYKASGT